eukprot:221936_1
MMWVIFGGHVLFEICNIYLCVKPYFNSIKFINFLNLIILSRRSVYYYWMYYTAHVHMSDTSDYIKCIELNMYVLHLVGDTVDMLRYICRYMCMCMCCGWWFRYI